MKRPTAYCCDKETSVLHMELYYLTRGVRPLAHVVCKEKDLIQEIKCANQDHPSTFIKIAYKPLNYKWNDQFIVYRTSYESLANELIETWNQKPLNHKKIGNLLGYDPDVVEYFCSKQRGNK